MGPIDNKEALVLAIGYELVANWRQVITWTNDDPVRCTI